MQATRGPSAGTQGQESVDAAALESAEESKAHLFVRVASASGNAFGLVALGVDMVEGFEADVSREAGWPEEQRRRAGGLPKSSG